MKKLFLNRWTAAIVGVLLLALVIWFLGPYFAFGEVRPLLSPVGRLIAILLLLFTWLALMFWRTWREVQGSRKLAQEVASQAEAPAVSARVAAPAAATAADAAQLQEGFAEAIARLKKDRKGGGNLYRMPWYVIIGPPGSGKTTALANSGLRFPMEQAIGRRAVRGVGGTRNCDWWFTEEAVLLDTAGRYTTQDSDRIADGAGWGQFLELLKRHRRSRPINGVLVAYSAPDLLTRSDAEFEGDVLAIRQRAAELGRHLGISLPVYLLVTKVDLISGFREYFDDLDATGRRQVWGATFAIDDSRSGRALGTLPAEFDLLLERLNAGLNQRLRDERDPRRRTLLFGFPQQFATLRERLTALAGEAFGGRQGEQPLFLRGVYFTSGTQEGTPVDRLLGSLGRSLGLATDVRAPVPETGRAYFIEQLLREVVLQESGVAGSDRRAELRKAALQIAAYAGIALLTVAGLVAMFVSHSRNASYLEGVAAAARQLEETPPAAAGAGLLQQLPRLDAVRRVLDTASHDGEDSPLSMHAGLYQGRAVRRAAREAYARELNATVVPALAGTFGRRLDALVGEPDQLYEYLKGYLMLGNPERLQPEQLLVLAALEWEREFGADPEARAALVSHLDWLLTEAALAPSPMDAALVTRARNALAAATPAALAYNRLKLAHAGPEVRPLRLDQDVQGLEAVFRRRSGRSLAEPVPALFTRAAFLEISDKGGAEIARRLQDDAWVFGEGGLPQQFDAGLTRDVLALYERDYISTWDGLLADLEVTPLGDAESAARNLGILGSSSSPLKVLLTIVARETNLAPPDDAATAAAGRAADQALAKAASSTLGRLLKGPESTAAPVAKVMKPGELVTEHFAELRKLVDGPPGQAPIDRTLQLLAEMSRQLGEIGDAVGGAGALQKITGGGGGGTARAIELEAAQMPPAVSGLLGPLAGSSQAIVRTQASGELAQLYKGEVVAECSAVVGGRYPFAKSGSDVPIADFSRLFGFGGVFDSFFKAHLAPLVDTTRSPWRWREAGGGAIGLPASMPAQFESADRIRQHFFRAGSAEPELRFSLTPEYLDAGVRRFVLEADGQRFEYAHGPQTRWALKWPGEAAEQVVATFDTGDGPGASVVFDGPWAIFRLLDASAVEPQSETRFMVGIQAGGSTARLRLDAASIRNPFGSPTLSRFRCGE
jgi:type VI secretion system protein ImpL